MNTRRWKDKKAILAKNIKLFIADELHLLNESNSTYEVVVSRMRQFSSLLTSKTTEDAKSESFQIIGLATSVADYRVT